MTSRIHYLVIGLICLITNACMQTKTLLTEPDEDLSRIKAPVYCGTYSSFITYGKNNFTLFNDSTSRLSNLICDSILKSSLKKLPRLNTNFVSDSADARLMARDFVEIINLAIQKESIKKFRANEVFARLTDKLNYDKFLFLVPTGYTRTGANLVQMYEQQYKKQNLLNIIGAGIAVASLVNLSSVNFIYFPTGQNIHAQGSNLYALIYTKSSGRFTFYRQQFFMWEQIHPMQRKYLKKQIEYLLKEYL